LKWHRLTPEGWELVDSIDQPAAAGKEQTAHGGNVESDSHSGKPVTLQPVPKRPSDNAFIAWRLRDLMGLKTQQQIADAMSEQLGRKVHQGEISRWLDEVDAYRKAGGIFPDLSRLSSQPQSIDPDLIDMGPREDGRTSRQRQRRDPDAE